MDQPPIIFVSGLPRSGSTLLMNLLGQNPRHYVAPANALLDLLLAVRDQWPKIAEFRAQGFKTVQPRIVSLMRRMIEGFYAEEFRNGKVVFDKHRRWLACIEVIEEVLQRPVSILVTVRDIRAIVASFEKFYQRYPMYAPRPVSYAANETAEGRAATHLAKDGAIGLSIYCLRDALRCPHKSRIHLLSYNQLCRNPREVLAKLHEQLELPVFEYNPDHVEHIAHDDGAVRGCPVQTIRSRVELADEEPWADVLSDELCNRLVRDYADIQTYSEGQ